MTNFSRFAVIGLTVAASIGPSPLASQQRPLKTKHVVLIVSDGVRWQELTTGAERALISRAPGGVSDTASVRKEFWRESPAERRAALFPFIWGTVATQGQIYGNPASGSAAHTVNPLKFSYPGYSEMLTGVYDPRITSNEHPPNENVTVFEWLGRRAPVNGRVAAIGTWGAFRRIFNRERAGFPVYDGWDAPFASAKARTPRQIAIDDFYRTSIRYWEDNAFDAPMFMAATEILKRDRPKLLFVGFGETDEWQHGGRYDLLLESAHNVDKYVAELWRIVQADPVMRGTTTFIITTDHGRGDGATRWKDHGEDVDGAEKIWMAVIGPDTPAHGDRVRTTEVTQAQIASTIAALLGQNWLSANPKAAPPIGEILGR